MEMLPSLWKQGDEAMKAMVTDLNLVGKREDYGRMTRAYSLQERDFSCMLPRLGSLFSENETEAHSIRKDLHSVRERIAMSSLQVALQIIRDEASSTTEQGKAFERLVKVFLENDPTQAQQYSKVWHYADWAKEHTEYLSTDTGIDLAQNESAIDRLVASNEKAIGDLRVDYGNLRADMEKSINSLTMRMIGMVTLLGGFITILRFFT